MAKRRTFNRLFKRYSKNRSNDFIDSEFLNPDTNIIGEEQTHWWDNLDENMSSRQSLIHNNKNETPKLGLNSQLESDNNASPWWKHLESSDNEGTSSRQNLSAVIIKTNVLQTSTSDSEKELNLKKRRVSLRVASRKSGSNAFLNALNDTEVAVPLKWRMKQTKYSNLHSNLDREDSGRESHENNEYSSDLSLSPNIVKVKSNIFKRQRGGGAGDQNVFQDVLIEGDGSNVRRKSVTFEKKSSKRSMHQNIDANKDYTDDQRKVIKQLSQTLPLENNKAGPSNLSTSKVVLENTAASDINKTVEDSDENDIEISNQKRFKFKSHLMQRARRSMGNNNFEDVLAENRDINLSEHNQDEEIDRRSIGNNNFEDVLAENRDINLSKHNLSQKRAKKIDSPSKSPLTTNLLSSPSRKSINRSKKKIDVTHERVFTSSPIRRSPRSLKAAKKHSLDTSAQVQDNIEQSTAIDAPSTSNVRNLPTFQAVNAENFEKIKADLDRLKIREMAAMKMDAEKKESALKAKNVKLLGATRKKPMKKANPPKVVDKAYLVNGKVYKPPRLPRPKHWATDHLYKFLWKCMEPKYQLSTRVRSEKFVLQLAKIVSFVEHRKKYENYKSELEALMKEMARLNIINTRNDFHHFCQDFMPYEFRVKVIPMLLPGNKQNIPFEPEKLNIPLLEQT
ncbi:enolase-phosphatase e1-like protein [Lasius niger]|uniref:Enolase-phosphatase e1-like protein n=1 Tax=Lasius niger TaxID=67767 RepID=A0A0J7KIL8_LASNI|nr:enolase-phosphatase e1-like protein [Lasius niger]